MLQAKGQTATPSPSSSDTRAERYQRIQKLLGERRAKLELEGGALVILSPSAQPCMLRKDASPATAHAVLRAVPLLCKAQPKPSLFVLVNVASVSLRRSVTLLQRPGMRATTGCCLLAAPLALCQRAGTSLCSLRAGADHGHLPPQETHAWSTRSMILLTW